MELETSWTWLDERVGVIGQEIRLGGVVLHANCTFTKRAIGLLVTNQTNQFAFLVGRDFWGDEMDGNETRHSSRQSTNFLGIITYCLYIMDITSHFYVGNAPTVISRRWWCQLQVHN